MVDLIRKSVSGFPWEESFRRNSDVNSQVQIFNETILNIMSNFIPNKMIKINPKDPPWINKNLKTMLNRQQRLYRNYKRHGFKPEDKIRVDSFREECLAEIQNEISRKLG